MLNYGYLNKTNLETTPFKGLVRCPMLVEQITLQPVAKRGDNSPDFKVVSVNGYDIGNAWIKATKHGEEFFSITLDSPTMPAPLNLTAFGRGDGTGAYDLVWQRPRQDGQRAKNVAQPVDNGQHEDMAA